MTQGPAHGLSIATLAAKHKTGEFPPPRELWGPIITEGSLTLLYAPRGIGKTFFALKLAHAIAAGSPFLKWKGGGARVLYFDGEMGYRELARRLTTIDDESAHPVAGDSIHVISYSELGGQLWNLSNTEHQRYYAQEMKTFDVTVIDNLLTATSPIDRFDDENKQWQRIQAFLIRARDAGKAVVLVHHAGKSGAQLGTSQRENIMDTILALRSLPRWRESGNRTGFELTFEKGRTFRGKDAEALKVEFGDSGAGLGEWYYAPMATAKAVQARKMKRMKISPRQIAVELGMSLYEVMGALSEMGGQARERYESDGEDF